MVICTWHASQRLRQRYPRIAHEQLLRALKAAKYEVVLTTTRGRLLLIDVDGSAVWGVALPGADVLATVLDGRMAARLCIQAWQGSARQGFKPITQEASHD